jgi:hypothetical protein
VAISYITVGSLATNITTTTLTITGPACNVDDILIAVVINKSAGNDFGQDDFSWTEIILAVNNCTTAADDHTVGVYWKRATASGGSWTWTKAVDDNLLFAGCISVWRGVLASGNPLDATARGVTFTVGAADDVSFPAFDPTGTDRHILFIAAYGNDATTFADAMSSDSNPDCTTRFDLETAEGNDCTLAITSGDNDGSNIAARTWASNAATDAGNTGVVFALIPAAVAAARLLALMGVGQ